MKIFAHADFLSLRMYNPQIERNGYVQLCGMQTILLRLQCVCFLGEIRHYFLTAAHIAYSK
jgi:hypothetical protein